MASPADGIPAADPQPIDVNGTPLRCLVCGGGRFWSKRVLMNTAGMTFLNLDWANRETVAVVCAACAFVHHFAH